MTRKQYQNRIRLIAVAEIAKQFRKAGIINAIVGKIKGSGLIVSGGLSNPNESGSLTPRRDDLFLAREDGKKAVSVRVYKISQGIPSSITIRTNIRFGVAEKYFRLTKRSPSGGWNVSEEGFSRLKAWIVNSKANFKIDGKTLDKSKGYEVSKLAFVIKRSIQRNGLRKRYDFDNPFYYKNRGVLATLVKAQQNINDRLTDLFTEQTMVRFTKLFSI